ncbi:MAG: flagellar hook capping FlgD N-terminal domain-containing protein [Pseudomonadota bacterium]
MSSVTNDPYASLGLGLPSTTSEAGKGDLAQNDFLKLMTAQLMNQDPFAPMENGEFLGQMAQFSTVSGIQSLQASFETLAQSLQASRVLQATSMVGKQVLVNSNQVELFGSLDANGKATAGTLRGAVDVPDDVSQVSLRILSASGETLHSATLPVSSAGMTEFNWNGALAGGGYAAPGVYKVVAEAKVGDSVESLNIRAASPVTSVSLSGDAIVLHTSRGTLNLDEVTRILA